MTAVHAAFQRGDTPPAVMVSPTFGAVVVGPRGRGGWRIRCGGGLAVMCNRVHAW